MKIIEPSFKITFFQEDALEQVERAGRICYQSDPVGLSEIFVRNLIKKGHETPLEQASATVEFVCDRGISHELVRHRLASFNQSCVIGTTQVRSGSGKRTIKELYDKYKGITPNGKTHIKTIRLRSVDEDNKMLINDNKISHVFYNGVQPVFTVKTAQGYTITCTKEHKFLTDTDKFIRLKNLKEGSIVMVNGRHSLLKISDDELKSLYLLKGYTPTEIANRFNCPYWTVRYRLKQLNIFEARKNDKDKDKYNKNHTCLSYAKMRETIIQQYKDGRTVWNKGLSEDDHPSVKRQGDSLRKNRYQGHERGELNPNWRGDDVKGYYKTQRNYPLQDNICEVCGQRIAKERHHIDRNYVNAGDGNILFCCVNCHKKQHFGWHIGDIVHQDKIISIEYAGMEDVYDLEMKNEANYIADGFVVHNSTRYCNYSKNKFGNEIAVIRPFFWEDGSGQFKEWKQAMEMCEKAYLNLLATGAKPQEARSVLPNSLKTDIVVTANMRTWRHIFKLRCSPKAHPQMRQSMLPVLAAFHRRLPVVFEDIYDAHKDNINQ